MTVPLIQIEELTRRFGKRTALDQLGLHVGSGEIVGLVGPNGSGKTTLLKMMAGFLKPTRGRISLFGLNPYTQRAAVMEQARFAFAPPPLFESLTAREHVKHLTRIRRREMPRVSPADIDQALVRVGLFHRQHDKVKTFSFGMRQRLTLALALLPKPRLLVLDEPTDGLDPLAILELRSVLKDLRRETGITILLSSHLLVEVDELVDRMLVLSEGKRIFLGTPDELCSGTEILELNTSDLDGAFSLLEKAHMNPQRRKNRIQLPLDSITLQEIIKLLTPAGIDVLEFHKKRPGLEEALLARLRHESNARESAEIAG